MADEYNYGKTCEFIVEARSQGSETKIVEKIVLIGGGKVVTNVTAEVSHYRRISVRWKPPAETPQGYHIYLYEQHGKTERLVKRIDSGTQNDTIHEFKELKCETYYRCRIYCMYDTQHAVGSDSNTVKTNASKPDSRERLEDFGVTKNITHTVIDKSTIELRWGSVDVGSNFKVTGYKVVVTRPVGIWLLGYQSTVIEEYVDSLVTHLKVEDVQPGYQHTVTIYATVKNLDSREDKAYPAEYTFVTKPSKTEITECSWKNGIVTFKWKPVGGVKNYQLELQDELLGNSLFNRFIQVKSDEPSECHTTIKMSGMIGIGRICVARVTADAGDDKKSESEWKRYLIGGDTVVRNVKCYSGSENPTRSLKVSFDMPIKGPVKQYRVRAVPKHGKTKTIFVAETSVTFEYLRSGVSYHFEVSASAKPEAGEWSESSKSNSVETDGKYRGKPMIGMKGVTDSHIDFTSAVLEGNVTTLNVTKNMDFGIAREVKPILKDHGQQDELQLTWIPPSFDNNASDYKVENYTVQLLQQNQVVRKEVINFDKSLKEYSSPGIKLDLGQSYKLEIYTIYIDIDQDELYRSKSHVVDVFTRPCEPVILCNQCKNDELTLKWNTVKGAIKYWVHISMENSDKPIIHDIGKKTEYKRELDYTFGYGMTYQATITAYGPNDKKNSFTTDPVTIGGEHVPTEVAATVQHIDVIDPNTQIFVSWKHPQVPPESYVIEAHTANAKFNEKSIPLQDYYLFTGLKAGTNYYFKVKAVYKKQKLDIASGGCASNFVKTNPTPTKVKKVWIEAESKTTTAAKMRWEVVDAEKPNEKTEYKVQLKSDKNQMTRKIFTDKNNVIFKGLQPGMSYIATVSAGNSEGFGRNSDELKFEMDLDSPSNVVLAIDEKNPSTSLQLSFAEVVGNVLEYEAELFLCENEQRSRIIGKSARFNELKHEFKDLQPNCIYAASVRAVFDQGSSSFQDSGEIKTAPSKPRNVKIKQIEGTSEITITWEKEAGCDFHKVEVKCGSGYALENTLTIENDCCMTYNCLHVATDYYIRIQAKNSSSHYGDWSEMEKISLLPTILESVSAELDEDGYGIKVQCNMANAHWLFYYMNIYCDGKKVDSPMEGKELRDKKVVEWEYVPKQYAQKYIFELWAQDSSKNKGPSAYFDGIVSRPQKMKMKKPKALGEPYSTDIEINWDEQERCDAYEVQIKSSNSVNPENTGRYKGTSCKYRCQHPGNTYQLCLRALCGSIRGEWSQDYQLTLVPDKVELSDNTSDDPTNYIRLKWKAPKVKPDGYNVRLHCGKDQITEKDSKVAEYSFDKALLKSGRLYYCSIAGYNSSGVGPYVFTKNYRIGWEVPNSVIVIKDENYPSKRATIIWDKPTGVNCFKLQIRNHQTGADMSLECVDTKFDFESGIPGNSYSIYVYSGCDGLYSQKYQEAKMTMKPESPIDVKATAEEASNGLLIEITDSTSLRKEYEVMVISVNAPENPKSPITKQQCIIVPNLIPGESYQVSVSAIVNDVKSDPTFFRGVIQTLPAKVVSLRSSLKDNKIIFSWDNLDIKPDKYILHWRINDNAFTEEHTSASQFIFNRIQAGFSYSVRVMASNRSGCGQMTDWETFLTDPSPPCDVKICKNPNSPRTSAIVRFQDKQHDQKRYRVTMISQDKGEDKEAEEIVTSELEVVADNLKPGTTYIASVVTLLYGKISVPAFSQKF